MLLPIHPNCGRGSAGKKFDMSSPFPTYYGLKSRSPFFSHEKYAAHCVVIGSRSPHSADSDVYSVFFLAD
jgi:hypothetical protein